jgi:hypothetical protein
MKTNDQSCKMGQKRTDSCAEMTLILQEKAAFLCFFARWERTFAAKIGGPAR